MLLTIQNLNIMKKFYTLLFFAITASFSAQFEGTWKLAQAAGALAVGPNQGDGSWWSNSLTDLTARDCLFDDSLVFDNAGNFTHYMDGNTWLETWQGAASDQCGAPVAPHDGSGSYTYTFTNNQLTVNGTGAHIGLPKVTNSGELSAANPPAVPTSITYEIMMSANSDTMTADINFGGGWWRFIYQKTSLATNPPAFYNVSLEVHTDLITSVSPDGMYAGGGALGGNNAVALSDANGDGVWTGIASFPEAGGHYTLLNGNCPDWSCKEDISGQPCADPSNYNDRLLPALTADTTLVLQYGSCDTPGTGIDEINKLFSVYPNPASDIVTISADRDVKAITVYNMLGNKITTNNVMSNSTVLDIESYTNGLYFVEIIFKDGTSTNSRFIKK